MIPELQQGVNLIADINQYVNHHHGGDFPHDNKTLWDDYIKSATPSAHEQLARIAYCFWEAGYLSPKMAHHTQFQRLMDYMVAVDKISEYHHRLTHTGKQSNTAKFKMWRIITQLHEIINEYSDPKTILFEEVI